VFYSPNPTYPFLPEHEFSLAGLQEWNSAARSVPKDNPLFHTLEALLSTEEEGMRAAYVPTHTGDPSDLFNLRQEGDTLREKIDDAKKALRPFVGDDLVIQNNTEITIARTSTWTEPPQL
jgi:hypothetical protein